MQTDLLLTDLQSKSNFRTEDFSELLKLFTPISVSKNIHLFRAGETVKLSYYILKGCIRQYHVDSEGDERVIHFATEGRWTGDTMSQFFKVPTNINLETLEDCELLSINAENFKQAHIEFVEFGWYTFINRVLTVEKFKLNMGMDTLETPMQKYIRFTQQQPNLVQRLPQYQIAAYLGITPETLSRIRKKIALNNIS